jgi:hypothetical protein
VTTIASLAKYGATMNHVPGTSFVRSYSPKAMAKLNGVPSRIDSALLLSASTANYALPMTICIAFDGFVSTGPVNPNTLGTIRVISELTFIGKALDEPGGLNDTACDARRRVRITRASHSYWVTPPRLPFTNPQS